jgi:hypothetical protein
MAKEPEGVAVLVPMVSVEVPDVSTEAGSKEHEAPLGSPLLHERSTVPVNPPTGATVIVDVTELPASTETVLGDAASVNCELPPPTVNIRVVVLVVEPDVPLTVITKVPSSVEVLVLRVSVDVPEPFGIEVGLNEHDAPAGTPLLQVNVTVPSNPPEGETVMVEFAEPPAFTDRTFGFADSVKPVRSSARTPFCAKLARGLARLGCAAKNKAVANITVAAMAAVRVRVLGVNRFRFIGPFKPQRRSYRRHTNAFAMTDLARMAAVEKFNR